MKRQTILVVDDDHAWLETIQLILGDEYKLEVTTEPSEAQLFMESTFFALVILDMRISADVTGVDLLMQLREVQHGLRAIILTGYAGVEDAVASMKVGALDYISKGTPDLANMLRGRVETALTQGLPMTSARADLAASETKYQELAEAINSVYAEMRSLITSNAGKPGLREALVPLREKLRALQVREAKEITKRYETHFRPLHEEGQELIRRVRQLLGDA